MNVFPLDLFFFFTFIMLILESLSDNSNSISGYASTNNLRENSLDLGHIFFFFLKPCVKEQ